MGRISGQLYFRKYSEKQESLANILCVRTYGTRGCLTRWRLAMHSGGVAMGSFRCTENQYRLGFWAHDSMKMKSKQKSFWRTRLGIMFCELHIVCKRVVVQQNHNRHDGHLVLICIGHIEKVVGDSTGTPNPSGNA